LPLYTISSRDGENRGLPRDFDENDFDGTQHYREL
jgi:hypothetical protein